MSDARERVMNVELLPATIDDMSLLRDWMRQLRTVDPMEAEQIVPFNIAEQSMRRLIEDASAGQVWIVRAGERPAGYVVLVFSFSVEFGGRTAFVDELFIAEEFRGKGAGNAPWSSSRTRQGRCARNLLLEVSSTNHIAQRLYERCGFTRRKYNLLTKWIGT